MQRNMLGLVAPDFVLRVIRRGVVGVPFVAEVFPMHFYYRAGNATRLRIPTDMISDLE